MKIKEVFYLKLRENTRNDIKLRENTRKCMKIPGIYEKLQENTRKLPYKHININFLNIYLIEFSIILITWFIVNLVYIIIIVVPNFLN